jgi:hypothetical protein
MSEPAKVEIREAVGVFHTAPEMEAAIEELEEHGFDRAEISLSGKRGIRAREARSSFL